MRLDECRHLPATPYAKPAVDQCETCGTEWSLRVCATCGHVGCCESGGAHALKHVKETGHPLILSLPLTEHSFLWCYACDDYLR